MATYNLTIVTPRGEPFKGAVEALTAPGEEGEFGVLAHHAPMIAAVKAGVLSVTAENRKQYFALGEGVLEVSEGGTVVVLADAAELQNSEEAAKERAAELNVHLG